MKHVVRCTMVGLVLGMGLAACSIVESEFEGAPQLYDRGYDYLSILQSSPDYAYESTDTMPVFTYQDPSDANLTELRTAYALDAAAGTGDELSRVFSLLRWAHQSLEHDPSGAITDMEDALTVLQHYDSVGVGVNAVLMSVVLNEAYLAMGFSSRLIHGNGRDWVFAGDWHAFVAVFSDSLGKWLFVDPTYQAYVTDGAGTPLSPAEIRERLISEQSLQLNADADYNGEPFDSGDYLHYLTANLYRFTSTVESAFGNYWVYHIPDDSVRYFVHLDPAGERQTGPAIATNYFTSNPEYFWQRP